jgi:hypothetical protein
VEGVAAAREEGLMGRVNLVESFLKLCWPFPIQRSLSTDARIGSSDTMLPWHAREGVRSTRQQLAELARRVNTLLPVALLHSNQSPTEPVREVWFTHSRASLAIWRDLSARISNSGVLDSTLYQ